MRNRFYAIWRVTATNNSGSLPGRLVRATVRNSSIAQRELRRIIVRIGYTFGRNQNGLTPIFDLQQFQNAIGNKYTVVREIGRGGTAAVFLAQDHKHGRVVAIKVLDTDTGMRSAAERFEREIRLVARLQHPNILPVFDSGVADGHLWYSMPFVEGESLRARLQREGALAIDRAVSMLSALADALSYAHGAGVIHRDIKPENILLSHSIPLIADFGIAAALDTVPGTRLTEVGMVVGTPQYMSPEQALGESAVDARSDIYSLGCVGFEMLSGKPPFDGANARAVVAQVLSHATPSIHAVRPEVSTALESVIVRAIAREPEDRWQTGGDFSAALTAARTDSKSSARNFRINTRAVAALVAATLIGIGALLWIGRSRVTVEPRRVATAAEHDSAAINAYRRGTARVLQRTQRTLIEGLALIDQAIRVDSSLAGAWAARANAYNWARLWEFQVPGVPRDSLLVRALAASERAIDLDSLDAEIWLVSAVVAQAIDPTRADLRIRAVRRAISLDPRNAQAWIQLGLAQQELGLMDSALVSLRRGMGLGEHAVGMSGYANHFYWRHQYDSAAVWSDSAIKYSPRLPYAWEMAGASAIMLHRLDAAQAYYDAALRLDQGPTRVRSLEGLAEIAAMRGDTAKALTLISQAEKLTDSSAPSNHAAISLASAYAAVGDRERALRWLEKYEPKGDLHFQLHVKRDAQLDQLRNEPRFRSLIKPRG